MPGSTVNRTVLQSFYQNPGDTYSDVQTEGAINTVADQVDANYLDYAAHNHDSRYYTQAQLDTRFSQVQAGVIVNGTITWDKFAIDVRTKRMYGARW